MNDRTMIGVVATALALGAFLFFFENDPDRRAAAGGGEEEGAIFPGLKAESVTEIGLNSGSKRVLLRKQPDGSWRMLVGDPPGDRVDERQVETLVRVISELRQAARPIEARGGTPVVMSAYGLESPPDKVVVTYRSGDGNRTVTLGLGNPVAEAGGAGGLGRVYARRNDEPDRVLTVGDPIRRMTAAIGRDIHYYRSRRFFDPADVSRHTILRIRNSSADGAKSIDVQITKMPESPMRVYLSGLDAPLRDKLLHAGIRVTPQNAPRDRADAAKAAALTSLLGDLRIEQFVDDPVQTGLFIGDPGAVAESRLAQFGLGEGDVRCEIFLSEVVEKETLQGRVAVAVPIASMQVSRKPVKGRPDLIYAGRGDAGSSVFAVKADPLEKLPLTLDELREPSLLPASVSEIKALKIVRGGRTVIELKGEGDGFSRKWMVADAGAEADSVAVGELVNALTTARATGFEQWIGDRAADPNSIWPDETRVEMTVELKPVKPESGGTPPPAGKNEAKLTLSLGKFPGKPATPPAADAKPAMVSAAVSWNGRRDGAVRMTEAAKLEALLKNRLEFYSRGLVAAVPEQVKEMSLTRPDGSYLIENRGTDAAPNWWVKSPYTAKADGAVSNWPTFFGRLDEQRLLKVVSDDAASAGRFGLTKPEYTLVFTVKKPALAAADRDRPPPPAKTESVTVRIGKTLKPKAGDVGPQPDEAPAPPPDAKPEDLQWFLRVGDGPLTYELSPAAVTSLSAELRDTRVPDFAADQRAVEIAVTGPAGSYTLLREEKDAPPPAEAPKAAPPPSAKVNVYKLRLAEGAQPSEIVDRRGEAGRVFDWFTGDPLDPKALRLQKYLSHVPDEPTMAKFGMDKVEFTISVTARAPAAAGMPKPPVKHDWQIGREVEIGGKKTRAMRKAGDPAIFLLAEADLKLLTRPGAEYLLPLAEEPPKMP